MTDQHDTIDGTVIGEEDDIERARRLPVAAPAVPTVPTVPVAQLSVTPDIPAADLVKRLDVIREAMRTAMVPGVDYGHVPGTNGKPSLFKPGSEKLSVLFQLDPQTTYVEHWGPGDHLTVTAETIVYHQPTGTRLGNGVGLCSTREKKYGKRQEQRACPECGKPAVIKGKAEYGGGWLCFKKKDGCGAKWSDGDPAIEAQVTGEVENPDIPDTWNTVLKMAKKRALVDAVLLVTGASALFTQDIEDGQPDNDDRQPATATAAAPSELTVTAEDIGALKIACAGLTGAQIKLAISACGLAIPNPPPTGPDGLFSWVPQSKAPELARKLAGIERKEAVKA